VTLLLAALAEHLATLPESDREPVDGFSPEKITGLFLTNQYETGDRHFKLLLSREDRDALKAIVMRAPQSGSESRVSANYQLLREWISDPGVDLGVVCTGIRRLVVVDVKLTRGVDNPQLVFESMNSTGKKLSQADLIRNFVLMDLSPAHQEHMYNGYWSPMEKQFLGSDERLFDEFVRHYLTLKTGRIPRLDDIYDAFKTYSEDLERSGSSRDELVIDLSRHAEWFVMMALGKEASPNLARLFREIEQLNASVVYPFLLRLYADYAEGTLERESFEAVLEAVISYVFRRGVCRIPTNSLNKTFTSLGSYIDPERYLESICGRLLTQSSYRRFPSDEEFSQALQTTDLYNFRRRSYFLRKLENHERKEEVSIAEYTIEHIMPQNPNLSPAWQQALGPDWQAIQDRLLHTLGNLTLTGYNPEYSDKTFAEKRDMPGGFKDSPLRLNHGLGQLDAWNEAQIEDRARRLASQAVAIWARPTVSEAELERYSDRTSEGGGFDWSLAHAILELIEPGYWTSYNNLAEAAGTGPQALGTHMSTCGNCPNPHRVLKWNGQVADNFQWIDPDDDRKPADLLRAEGVRVDGQVADPEQRLTTADLLALVGELD
jgi:uncharacterized protein with ParB-like and HNH nuclease domain/alkylated DNA nucleotide flippase Atl1